MILPPSIHSCHADKNPQQHIPLQEYSENLKEITWLLASAGVPADKVIFITPPPVHESAWEKECILKGSSCGQILSSSFTVAQTVFRLRACRDHECLFASLPGSPLNRHNSVAGQYAQACVQAAGQCGTDILDLWTLMQKDGQVSIVHQYWLLLLLHVNNLKAFSRLKGVSYPQFI